MRMEILFTHPYALVRLYLCGISWLYKAFTLSIQCKCANCTSVYKATYLEGFQMLLKKLFAHSSNQMIITFHWLISMWALLKIVFNLIKGLFFFFPSMRKQKKGIIERQGCWLKNRYWLVFVDVKSLCKVASSKHWFWEFSLF